MFRAVFLATLLFHDRFGAALIFTADPAEFSPGLTQEMFLSCRPRSTAVVGFSQLMAIQIAQRDVITGHLLPVASAFSGQPDSPTQLTINSPKLLSRATVRGFLDIHGSDHSFLKLTLTALTMDDAGTYVCVVSGLNEEGLVTSQEATLNITYMDLAEEERLLKASLDALLQRVESLERDQDVTNHRLVALEANNTALMEQVAKFEQDKQQVAAINSTYFGALYLDLIQQNQFGRAVFSVARTLTPIRTSGHIYYDTVVVNHGIAFNTSSHVFQPPLDGVYLLMATVAPYAPDSTPPTLIITINSDEAFRVTPSSAQGQGFNAVLLPLQTTDRVDTLADIGPGSDEGFCSFAGFLVASFHLTPPPTTTGNFP